jgi:2-C-methyl-D-erythritol 4-phosphate cytidylyltransferase
MHITPAMTCDDTAKLLYQGNIIATTTKKTQEKQAPYPQAHG